VIARRFYDRLPFPGLLLRHAGAIPVDPGDSRTEMAGFVRSVKRALERGELVCIFAEGTISRTGLLQGFRGGVERLSRVAGVPIVPLWIGGAWGSSLSYAHGELFSRLPVLPPPRVTLMFGTPLPPGTDSFHVRQQVAELSCRWFDLRRNERGRRLGRMLLASGRRNWRKAAVADSTGLELRYGELLTSGFGLAGSLRHLCGEERVAVLLPPSVAGALANAALALAGKVPVNLNHTLPPSSFRACWEVAGARCLLTTRGMLQRFPGLPLPPQVLLVEELAAETGAAARFAAWIRARLLPASLALPAAVGEGAVLFSSGSTSEPKGISLSHHALISNIEAVRSVLRLSRGEVICSGLPFFHSLGLTGTLWLPLLSGLTAAYHPNPLEGEKLGRLVRRRGGTVLVATPTFLGSYRRVPPQDFATLRLVVTGGEKLRKGVAEEFFARFGMVPLEGYGATELSPVVALNVPDASFGGITHHGSREGSVGIPLPGVAVRIRDLESGEVVGPGELGMVEVKGPNLMAGYLGAPGATADAVSHGWYRTGDLGRLDADGFLFIGDRLARFSKIGGEMVPHAAVEEELNRLAGVEAVAVTALPDERKGEMLVALVPAGAASPDELRRLAAESRLPNLWKPARYYQVEELPLLGSGKVDIRRLRGLAAELAEREGAASR
ncbi:MAG TPA: AMP-binding protein, partial [Verrucomicrobiae bacterium]|nr:AMP-binding protein [Verrucomicrobiae bacterium]